MWEFVLFYLQLLFCTVGMLIACGLVVAVLQKLFLLLIGNTLGYRAIVVTGAVGTPIHEMGHAAMCVLFGHTIEEISLYNPHPKNGMLGYVKHSYNKRNLYHQLGNFLIGLGPIFSGALCLIGILFLCFNTALRTYFQASFSAIHAGGSVFDLCRIGLDTLPLLFTQGNVVLKVIGLLLILSIMLHVNLSTADIKNSLPGAGIYAGLLLLFAGIVWLFGAGAVASVKNGASIFLSYCIVVFMVIFAFSAAIIALSAVLYLIRYWFVKK